MEAEIGRLGARITLEPGIVQTLQPFTAGRIVAPNRYVAQPMEGCDGTLDGRPDELTFRRWGRIAAGGCGILWGEATAVVPEGRANPRQLLLDDATRGDFARLVDHARTHAMQKRLVIGVQLTHSGRYSYPSAIPAATLDDEEMRRIGDAYVRAARLASEAGADFVDVKQCHGYLLSERLGDRARPLDERLAPAIGIVRRIRDELPGLIVATRINVFDGVPFGTAPQSGCGFGVDASGEFDVTEPIAALRALVVAGVELVNVTAGVPYANPHVGRPADRAPVDGYASPEHPLVGVARHFALAEAVTRSAGVPVVGTGYSYLRQFLAMAGEANVRSGRVSLVGVGRGTLAYPDFVRDLMERGELDVHKTCLTVSHCTNLMRSKGNALGQFAAGCVPRDALYAQLLREARST